MAMARVMFPLVDWADMTTSGQTGSVNTHFIKQVRDTEFIAKECVMFLVEWVSRRIAFLKRNSRDDANHPQWTVEQLTSAKLEIGGVVIRSDEIEYITQVS
uniref:SAICAR synthetase/ADE2 N-terminal domain-containing protein n=1 Tax=Strigamia maritima TaxID=126957 RepID=T1JBL8_STRMM